MRVALCSIFRNSTPYLDTYFGQVDELRKHFDLTLFLAEGDSADDTLAVAREHATAKDTLLYIPHGGPHFGSVDNPQRWEQIAQVVRPVLDEAIASKPDILVWVESDLIWDVNSMVKLIKGTTPGRSVAPMVFDKGTDRFYDVWGFRLNGKGFQDHMPYFPSEPYRDGDYAHIDSCGSCFVTQDLRAVKNWSGHWPFPSRILWVDTTVSVR